MSTIVFKWRDEYIRVNPEDIVYFRADGNYSIMTLTSRKERLLSMNLSGVFEILESQLGVHVDMFERVGRSLIIRKKCIFGIHVLKKQLILAVSGSNLYFELQVSKEALKKLKENQEDRFKVDCNLQLRELQTRKSYPLFSGNNLFGRQSKQSNCKNQIDNGDNQISRSHFCIIVHFETEIEDYSLSVMDLNSANGTFVNNQSISAKQPLQIHIGDIIRAGRTDFILGINDTDKTEIS